MLMLLLVVQSLSCVRLFVTPWTATCQASLFFTISRSLLKLTSFESVMLSNHLILCHPLLFLPFLIAQLVKKKPPAIQVDPGSTPGSGRSTGEGIGYPLQYFWASLVVQLVKNLPALQRPGFDPWVGKIPWRREWLTTPGFWPGEFHRLYSPWGCKESDTTERLSLSLIALNFSQHRGLSQ